MADDILKYEDFIEEDGSLDKLIAKLEEADTKYTELLENVRTNAKKTADELRKLSAPRKEENDGLGDAEVQVKELEEAQKKLTKSQSDNAVQLAKLNELKRQQLAQNKALAREQIARDKLTKANQNLTKANQNLIKQSIKLINDEKTSYELLSAQYSKMKLAVNALSVEYRENTAEGKALVKNTNNVYQQMIKLQSVTGKNTLQVGDYSKATYGLNANINNLTRELPNLGVSASTFFLSISNNLPMLKDSIDQIKRVNKNLAAEGLKTTSVWKQLGKSIISWNTAISIAVALLTVYGAKIVKWVQKQRELNKEIEKGVKAQEDFNSATLDGAKNAAANAAETKILYSATQDLTRSLEERNEAAQALIDLHPETFEGLTTEELLAGKAKKKYDELTASIIASAKAEAYKSKIVENEKAILDKEDEIAKKQQELNDLEADYLAKQEEYQKAQDKAGFDPVTGAKKQTPGAELSYMTAFQKFKKEEAKLGEDRVGSEEEINEIKQSSLDLEKRIHSFSFSTKKGGSGGKSTDPVLDALEAQRDILSLQEDGLKKELELLDNQIQIDQHKNKENEEYLIALKDWGGREKIAIFKKYSDQEQKLEDDMEAEAEKDAVDRAKKEGKFAAASLKEKQKMYKAEVKAINDSADLRDVEIDLMQVSEQEKTRLKREAEMDRMQQILDLNKAGYNMLTEQEIKLYVAMIEKLRNTTDEPSDKPKTFWDLLGIDVSSEGARAMQDGANMVMENINMIADARVAASDKAVAAAEAEVAALEKAYDAEIEARNNGYANSADTAKKELQLARKTQEQALKEQAKAQKAQDRINTITQTGSLITASANIFRDAPWFLAVPLVAAMFGTFAAAKVEARKAAAPVTYGEGGSEFLDFGGSHASGNDIQIGHTKDGRERRAERGEMLAVINKRSTSKYRRVLPGVIDSLNKGKFLEQYGNSYDSSGIAVVNNNSIVDTSKMEGYLATMSKQGERRIYTDAHGNVIEIHKNLKRITRAS